jgi:hypothetical protein
MEKKFKEMNVPLRYNLLQIVCRFGPINNQDIFSKAHLYYGKEKQCNPQIIDGHLEALRASGLISEGEENSYIATCSGSSRLDCSFCLS